MSESVDSDALVDSQEQRAARGRRLAQGRDPLLLRDEAELVQADAHSRTCYP